MNCSWRRGGWSDAASWARFGSRQGFFFFLSPLMIKITQRWVSLSWWLSLALTHSNYSGVYSQQTHSHATDRKVAPCAEERWQERAKRCLFKRPPESFCYILERGFIALLKNHCRWMQNKKFTLPITSPFWPITSCNLVSDRFLSVAATNRLRVKPCSVNQLLTSIGWRNDAVLFYNNCFFFACMFYYWRWRCTNSVVHKYLCASYVQEKQSRVSENKLRHFCLIDTNIKLDKSLLTSCSWTQRWTRQLCKTGKERLPFCVTTCYFLRLNLTLSNLFNHAGRHADEGDFSD